MREAGAANLLQEQALLGLPNPSALTELLRTQDPLASRHSLQSSTSERNDEELRLLADTNVMVVSGREGLIRSETMSRGANAQVNDYKMAGHGLYTRDRPNYSGKGPQHMMDAIHVGR